MKKFVSYSGKSFEEIKKEADTIMEFVSIKDFQTIFENSVIKIMGELKLKLYGFYSYHTNYDSYKYVGTKKTKVVRCKKHLIILKNGRTHELIGTKLVAL